MAFATRTLIDTGSTDTGSGKIVILIDLTNHDGAGLFLDNQIGCAAATGLGEEILKTTGGKLMG